MASDGVDEIGSRSVPKRPRIGEGLLQCPAMAWDERMKDFHVRRAKARAMGGPDRTVGQNGSLTIDVPPSGVVILSP